MIDVIGMGMGSKRMRTLEAQEALEQADIIIGAKRLLESLEDELCPNRIAEYRADAIVEILEQQVFTHAALLVSGDISFYSGGKALGDALAASELGKKHEIRRLPGISSISYLCGKLGIAMEEVAIHSAHGQDCDVVAAVLQGRISFFLTGGQQSVAALCQELVAHGLGELEVALGSRLSYEDEEISRMKAKDAALRSEDTLAVLVVWPPERQKRGLPGIEDAAFIRDAVPMTKRMVRMNAICLLNPKPHEVCWDIGAGTGSVSVELSMQAKKVYAIEKKPQAVALLEQNRQAFGAYNMEIIAGEAPEALNTLEAPQVVFIGGSSGRVEDIVALLPKEQVRLCITAVTLETLHAATRALTEAGFDPRVIQLSVTNTKKVGAYHMLDGENPVFIIYGER